MHHSATLMKQTNSWNEWETIDNINLMKAQSGVIVLGTHCPISEESSVIVTIQIRADLIVARADKTNMKLEDKW